MCVHVRDIVVTYAVNRLKELILAPPTQAAKLSWLSKSAWEALEDIVTGNSKALSAVNIASICELWSLLFNRHVVIRHCGYSNWQSGLFPTAQQVSYIRAYDMVKKTVTAEPIGLLVMDNRVVWSLIDAPEPFATVAKHLQPSSGLLQPIGSGWIWAPGGKLTFTQDATFPLLTVPTISVSPDSRQPKQHTCSSFVKFGSMCASNTGMLTIKDALNTMIPPAQTGKDERVRAIVYRCCDWVVLGCALDVFSFNQWYSKSKGSKASDSQIERHIESHLFVIGTNHVLSLQPIQPMVMMAHPNELLPISKARHQFVTEFSLLRTGPGPDYSVSVSTTTAVLQGRWQSILQVIRI